MRYLCRNHDMEELIDTHCHLYLPEFDADRGEMMDRARQAGVSHFLLPNIDSTSVEAMVLCAAEFPECLPMMGLHPCSVKEGWKEETGKIENLLNQPGAAWYGIGETGLDYFWDHTFIPQQKQNFALHIQWAIEKQLPLIIHSRDALDDCIAMVKEAWSPALRGIFHCFSGNRDQAEQIMELGFYLGIGGVVTFKNGGLDRVLPLVGLEYLVLETDAPYLAPVPYRGKRNESGYLPLVLSRIAAIRQEDPAGIAAITTRNARKLFGIPDTG